MDTYEVLIKPKIEEIKKLRAAGVTYEKIAEFLGIKMDCLLKQRKKHPELNDALTIINNEIVQNLRQTLFSLAEKHTLSTTKTIYKNDEVVYQETVTKDIDPSYVAINMLLKNYDRDNWREDWGKFLLQQNELELKKKKQENEKWD